jgi:hypothetical protein
VRGHAVYLAKQSALSGLDAANSTSIYTKPAEFTASTDVYAALELKSIDVYERKPEIVST